MLLPFPLHNEEGAHVLHHSSNNLRCFENMFQANDTKTKLSLIGTTNKLQPNLYDYHQLLTRIRGLLFQTGCSVNFTGVLKTCFREMTLTL